MTDFANLTIEWGTTPSTITLLELMKQQLGITVPDDDDELSMYLDMAGIAAENYIDNIIEGREVTERLAHSRQGLALRYWPANSLVLVEVDGVDVTEDFTLYFDEGLGWAIRDSGGTYGCFDQMDITYTAGYNPLPSDLGFAIVQAGMSYQTGSSGGAVKRESIVGVGSVEYATTDEQGGVSVRVGQLPAACVAVLDRYKRLYA